MSGVTEVFAAIAAVGSIATAAGVWFAYEQLQHAKDHAQTDFEDNFSREYRTIMAEIPVVALFVDGPTEIRQAELLAFYRYFDLCNEQLFLAKLGRVSEDTRGQWEEGIRGNLQLPTFSTAWREIAVKLPEDYLEELRALVPPRSV